MVRASPDVDFGAGNLLFCFFCRFFLFGCGGYIFIGYLPKKIAAGAPPAAPTRGALKIKIKLD